MKAQKTLVISLAALGLFGVAGATFVAVNGTSTTQDTKLTLINPVSSVDMMLASDVPTSDDEGCGELYAQQAGPRGGGFGGGGQQGGPPEGGMQGGPGGMRGGRPQGPMILRDPKVQTELKLNEGQIGQIQEALQELRPQGGPGGQGGAGQGQGQGGRGQGGRGQGGGGQQGQGGFGGGGQGGPPGGGRGGMIDPEVMQQFEAKLKTILNEGQFSRYQQLALQSAGPQAFMQPPVVDKLGLSEEQLEQMRGIMEANRPPMGQGGPGGQGGGQGGFGGGGQGQPPQDPAEMKARDEKLMKDLLAVLTSSQKSTWQSMIGEKFEFTVGQQRGGQRGGGGRPGGGGGGGDEVTQDVSIVF
jgi:hypothetical protein